MSDYSLKIPRLHFNPLVPGGNKRLYILKQTFSKDFQVRLNMYFLLLPAVLMG